MVAASGSAACQAPRDDVEPGRAVVSHTQISSLVAAAPDFLATLPSFRAQSPPVLYRSNVAEHGATPPSGSPPSATPPPTGGAVPRNADRASPPLSSDALPTGAWAPVTAPTTSSADGSPRHYAAPPPGLVQRSSSICEATVDRPTEAPMLRTESVPALVAYAAPPADATAYSAPPADATACAPPTESTAIPSAYSSLQQQQPYLAPPAYRVSAAQPAYAVAEACASQSAAAPALSADGSGPQSPLRMAAAAPLPVYSGFAQLATEGVRNAEESNAKQFFYQNW